MGIEATLPADLAVAAVRGWLPVTVTVREDSALPHAGEFRALGRFDSGFELLGSDERALFSTSATEGNAVAVWLAAALAAATGGTLEDPQASVTATAASGAEILATLLGNDEFARSFAGPESMAALKPAKAGKAPKAAKAPKAPKAPKEPKPPKPPKEPKAKKAAVARPAAAARPSVAMVEADLSRPVRAYAAAERFEIADRVEHPSFGEGVVELSEPGKVTVFFPTGRRMLGQSRDGALTEAVPGRRAIDHAAPTPGSKPGR